MKEREEQLQSQITQLSDYDEAAQALNELKHLNRELAEKLALEILLQYKGDQYLQATAFRALYSADMHKGIELIKNPPTALNMAVLNAMIECITEDSGIVADHPEVLETARLLKATIKNLGAEETHRIKDSIKWFLETYPDI